MKSPMGNTFNYRRAIKPIVLLLGICIVVFFYIQHAKKKQLEVVTGISLGGEYKLVMNQSRSMRLGAEGWRVMIFEKTDNHKEKSFSCDIPGYESWPAGQIASTYPVLAEYLDKKAAGCIRIYRAKFHGASVIQGNKLIVLFVT